MRARSHTIVTRVHLVALAALCALGCDPASPDDAGIVLADGGTALVRVRLGVEDGDGDWRVTTARLELDEVRADNDRGGAMEPVWLPSEPVALEEEAEMELAGVPATYGGLGLRSRAGAGSAFAAELSSGDGDRRLELVSGAPYDLDLRCAEGPLRLESGGNLTIRARLDVAALVEAMESEGLPSEEDGVIVVDATRAPDALAAAEEAFLDAWTLDCDQSDSD